MTPAQQKAYYAKNKTDAAKKEADKDYELVGSRGDAARKGMAEGRMDAMGTAYKKGGKVMKKMKRYEDGGEIESAQGQNKSIGDDVRARAMAAMEKGSSEEPAVPKKTAAKLTPKAEAPTPKAEPKAEKVSSVQQAKDVVKGKDITTPSPKSFTEAGGNAKASSAKADLSGFKVKVPDVLSGFDSKGKRTTNMKSGGKVSSASKRADGCAIRGKTRA
jgi:hypothetical protein